MKLFLHFVKYVDSNSHIRCRPSSLVIAFDAVSFRETGIFAHACGNVGRCICGGDASGLLYYWELSQSSGLNFADKIQSIELW